MHKRASLLVLVLGMFASSAAMAFPQFETKVPNGRTNGCLTCHTHSGGGEGWNKFGQEILKEGGANPDANPNNQNLGFNGDPVWADLCDLDSDGDGATNGEELGDATCVWAIGDPDPAGGNLGAPGDPAIKPGDDVPANPDNGRDTLPPADGDGDGGGGCAATGASSTAALVLVLVALRRRRA
jgi:uncharacterized protein (TIGR03382 family)